MTQVILTSKSWSNKLQTEIVKELPLAYKVRKNHIAGVGYVYFIYDAINNKIGQCFKDVTKGMVLNKLN